MKHLPRKRFGQNFLHDNQVIDRLLSLIHPAAGDELVEVGPGMGALTLPLLARAGRLSVIEIDRDLVARLEALQLKGLTIISADVLTFDWQQLHLNNQLRIVGNLPYNIGTPLLLRLLDVRSQIKDIHVMLQKEVVDRLHARVGTRAYGRLSVIMQSCFQIDPLMIVPPGSFKPPPKVQSAVVRLVPRQQAPNDQAVQSLQLATRLAFAKKRKTLRNNLREYIDTARLSEVGIDPQARAETLDLRQFALLATLLT